MIRVIIAYDDNDAELGDYFDDSFKDFDNNLSINNNTSTTAIRGLECNETNIKAIVPSNIPYIFIGLSHGNEQQLLTENDVYADSKDVLHFKNSLFYSPSCSTAIELGKRLIEAECVCYIGCARDTLATYEDFYHLYIDCENYCIKEFINSNKTIETTYDEMLKYFDSKIDELFEQGDDEILVAMELQHNKDSFVLEGNKQLTIKYFDL